MDIDTLVQRLSEFRTLLNNLQQASIESSNPEQAAQEALEASRQQIHLAMEIADEAYHQAEELDAIIMAMADAVILYNMKGLATRANPAAILLFGIDPVGLNHLEMIDLLSLRHPDGSPVEVEKLPSERALLGEPISGERLLFIDDEGNERIVHASASPLFKDTAVSAVVTVWHDVTEREQLLEQLEIEQSRLETIIRNAPEAILVADEEGRLVLGNPAAERILGRALPYGQEVNQHAGLHICYSDGTPYDARNLPLTRSALDGEQINNIELLVELPDGQLRNLLASTAPIVDRKGNLNGAVGIFQDITRRKQAEEELRRQASRSQLLASLSRAFAEAGLHYHELLETVVSQVGKTFGELCCLQLLAEDGRWYYPAAAFFENNNEMLTLLPSQYQEIHYQVEEGAAGQVFRTGQPVIIDDLPAGQLASSLPVASNLLQGKHLSEFFNALLVPLRAHGRWIGLLSLLRLHKGNHFTAEEQAFLQDLADRAALAIEGTWLYERETQRAGQLQALHQATTALLSTIDLETLLAQILNAAKKAIPAAEQGVLFLSSKEDSSLQVRAAFGGNDPNPLCPELKDHALRAGLEKRPMILRSFALESGSTGSAIIAPLALDQTILGALVLFGSQAKLFSDNDLSLLDNFAITATAALQNATLYSEVQRLATMDTLTEQFNRRKFFELGEMEMHRLRRFHNPLSAIMLDVDNFKEINDTYGHAIGDQVLRSAAQRCRASIRVVDILGRYGGDEFAILLPGAELAEAGDIAERIRLAMIQSPISTERGGVQISISLGVTQAQDSESLSTLLGRADAALYSAKESGRNRVMQD